MRYQEIRPAQNQNLCFLSLECMLIKVQDREKNWNQSLQNCLFYFFGAETTFYTFLISHLRIRTSSDILDFPFVHAGNISHIKSQHFKNFIHWLALFLMTTSNILEASTFAPPLRPPLSCWFRDACCTKRPKLKEVAPHARLAVVLLNSGIFLFRNSWKLQGILSHFKWKWPD